MKKFVILDGSSLVYRAFFALPPLTNGKGEYTNALFGFANMLFKLWEDLSPIDALAIAFDKSRVTFRTNLFADYKGTRAKTPPELSAQIPKIAELAACLGIKFIEKEGYEADDIIGTLTSRAAAAGYKALAVTGDRDALQLIDGNVNILYTQKGVGNLKVYDEEAFAADYGGLKPKQLIDIKALMGDSSDNIPGIAGVGKVTAIKLIQEFETTEQVLLNADKVKGAALKKKIADGREAALLSKKLATIERNVPDLDFDPKDFVVTPDREKMRVFCEDNELRKVWQSFAKIFPAEDNLFAAATETAAPPYKAAKVTSDAEEIKNFAEPLSLYAEKDAAGGVNIAAAGSGSDTVFFATVGAEQIAPLLEGKEVVVWDAKDLYHLGFKEQEKFFDATVANYLINPAGGEKADDFLGLCGAYLPDDLPQSFAEPKDEFCFKARLLPKLGDALRRKLRELNMTRLYADAEQPLPAVLGAMEEAGVYADKAHLNEKSAAAQDRIESLREKIYAAAGEEFNIGSPKQLSRILFDKLGLKPAKKNKSGGYSTNAEVLNELRGENAIIGDILDYRLWTKLKSTYLDGIGALINPATGRVHTTFNQKVTATGRLSSSEPNLQNIPVRTEEGREIRACFEPGDGYDLMLSADYSQIELRVLASLAGDENMIAAFKSGQDIHAHTAATIFGVKDEEVTPDLRRRAKAINFGIVYGLSDYGLAKDIGVSRKEAAEYIEGYFQKYAAVKSFLTKIVEGARADGFVKTLFNRRRELPAITSSDRNLRGNAERMAMNTPIQGTAADIIKLAMIAVAKRLKDAGLKSRMLLQVHDELVFETTVKEADALAEIVRSAMEGAANLAVPLTVNISVGKNWAQAK